MATLAVLFWNRLLNVSLVGFAGFACALFVPTTARASFCAPSLALLSASLLALLMIASSFSLAGRVERFARRKIGPSRRGRLASRVAGLSNSTAILGLLEVTTRARVVAVCLARQALGVTVFFACVSVLALGISRPTAGVARAVAILVTLIPISSAGVGIREGGLILALTHLGVASGAAVAFSLLLLARDLPTSLAGGVIEAWSHLSTPNRVE